MGAASRPLDGPIRASMEKRFGVSFEHVRVHDDRRAHEAAQDLQAHAFTVGSHIAFAEGRFKPSTHIGTRLIAHELAHVVQQANSASVAIVQGRWDQASAECASEPQGKWITRVVVDQATPQSVTMHWSDGTSQSARCSSGKGHCCVAGPGSASPCPGSASHLDGSNCTPITTRNGYLVKHRDLDHRGIPFWVEFVPDRYIALHEYPRVDGTPLSHGCVRLDRATAMTIFCGVRQDRTWVQVHNEVRPECSHPALQREWLMDFASGGTDLSAYDGDHRAQHAIRVTRRMINRAFGRTLTVAEIRQLTVADIPRCVQRSTVEESRLDPSTPGAPSGSQILAGTPEAVVVANFQQAYGSSSSVQQAAQAVSRHAERLWQTARTSVRSGGGRDDRPLYWARLAMSRTISDSRPRWARSLAAPDLARAQIPMLATLENQSRGRSDAIFSTAAADEGKKRILISGFDPFGLQANVTQSNPSGAAALAFDGRTLTSPNGAEAIVEAVVFPVRFADFDAGIVERFFSPFLGAARPPDIIVTISQGNVGFELEQFAGRRRSSGGYQDNLNTAVGVGVSQAVVPPGMGTGPEFIETTTSQQQRRAMASGGASGFRVVIDEMVTTRDGSTVRGSTAIAQGARAGRGSGGGFLSNEIFYRVVRLASTGTRRVPVIHLHTPRLNYGSGLTSAQIASVRARIVSGTETILSRVIDQL